MNKSIKLDNRYAWPRFATGAFALGAALLVAPLGVAQNDDEEVFELSPFTVEGSQDSGYRATSTLAGTRIRTNLKDVGSSISVVTEEFLRDTSATDNESLLLYTMGTEVGGINGTFAGGGDFGRVDTDDQRLRPNQATRVRGLAAADNTRDFFVTDIPWDSYIVDRVDLQRGPNSVLFGLGSPAGVINATTNAANFENGGDLEVRFGSYGTRRVSVDYNQVILEDELAIRAAVLDENQQFQQKEAFEKDKRYFVAMKWEPKFLGGDSSSTTIKANYEKGDINANRPRVIPPIDRITPWFTPEVRDAQTGAWIGGGMLPANGQKLALGVNVNNEQGASSETAIYNPWIGTAVGRIFDGPIAVYNNTDSTTQDFYFLASGGDQKGGSYQGINSLNTVATNTRRPGWQIAAWKPETLTDSSIFNFYDHLIDGPNKSEFQEWDAYNVSFSHNMMDNKLGFEIAYDVQNYEDGQTNLLDNNGQSISVDIMRYLPAGTSTSDGVATNTMLNPNYGRPYIGGDAQNNYRNIRDRKNFRVTGYYDIDFRDTNSDALGSVLGRHVFTAVYSKSEFEERKMAWLRNASANYNTGTSITQASRYVANLIYLGDSLAGAATPAGANLSALNNVVIPSAGSFVYNKDNGVNSSVQNLTVWSADTGDIDNLYKSASLARNVTDSKAFVWQGYLFDGIVVPVFGYREDTDKAASAGNVPGGPVPGSVSPYHDDWILPNSSADLDIIPTQNASYVTASGASRTFSVVVHTPPSLRENMGGWGIDLSYSKSSNFRPDASRKDLLGNTVAPARGETEEYGIALGGLDDRFFFKVNRYETKVFNDTLSGSSIANSYMIGAGEGWGFQFAYQMARVAQGYDAAGDSSNNGYRGVDFNLLDQGAAYDPVTNPAYRQDLYDAGEKILYQRSANTLEAANAAYAQQQRVLQAYGLTDLANGVDKTNWPSQQFISYWKQDWDGALGVAKGQPIPGAYTWNGEPSKFVVTGDTVSKGWEYELFFQPTESWNITVNATKTEATRESIAQTYSDWVEDRAKLFSNESAAWGESRLWGPWNNGEVGVKYEAEFISNYSLFRELVGSNVAELRPWRYNVITNYRFDDGVLGGVNVGGAWRWEDKVVIGYPFKDATGAAFDTSKPFYGDSESSIDFWVGYGRPINDRIDWRVQLNVSNAFADEALIPVTVQPDGSAATSRIRAGQSWTITNTFEF